MGSRGPLRQGQGVEVIGESPAIPQPPGNMHPVVLEEWYDYWSSRVSHVADTTDVPVLRRLFVYRDEWAKLAVAYNELPMEERTVAGSRNADALRMHPFTNRMDQLEKLMLPLEDRFGLSPLSRARLGIEVGQAHLTWEQVRQRGIEGPQPQSALPPGMRVIEQ